MSIARSIFIKEFRNSSYGFDITPAKNEDIISKKNVISDNVMLIGLDEVDMIIKDKLSNASAKQILIKAKEERGERAPCLTSLEQLKYPT